MGVVAPGTASTAGAVPAAVIPDETTDDVPPAGADSPLRVAHESEDDWEDQFVKDPEAAKEATRERMEEQFEREHEERQREAGGSADPSAAASVDRDPEGRHAVAEQPVTEQPVTEQPVADGATPPSAYQVGGVPVDRAANHGAVTLDRRSSTDATGSLFHRSPGRLGRGSRRLRLPGRLAPWQPLIPTLRDSTPTG